MPEFIRTTLRWLAMGFAAVALLLAAPAAAQDGEEIQVETFYRELEPYGRWFEHPRFGHVWAPEVDSEDWRPYSRGNWVHTEEHGWFWESEEPFGWAVYHYGRWHRDEEDGWIWVPGTEWGPAWVAWRHNDEDVGWAPLPPEAEWRDGEIALGSSFYDNPRFSSAWCFVPVAMLTSARVWTRLHTPRRNTYYLGRTRFVPWQRGTGHGFYNAGFDRRRYESITGQRIGSYRLRSVDRPFWDGPRGARSGGDLRVYRPRVIGLPRSDGRPGFTAPAERRAWPDRWGDRRPGSWDDRRRGDWGDRSRDRDGDGRFDRDRGSAGSDPQRRPGGEPTRREDGIPIHQGSRPRLPQEVPGGPRFPQPRTGESTQPSTGPRGGGEARGGGEQGVGSRSGGGAGPVSSPRNGDPGTAGGARFGGGQTGGPRTGGSPGPGAGPRSGDPGTGPRTRSGGAQDGGASSTRGANTGTAGGGRPVGTGPRRGGQTEGGAAAQGLPQQQNSN